MQGAGEGRELSITFQASGKAVRLGAPEKWRKAVAGEDLKPDTRVEIHRQGGSPQTVRADEVPELHAIFLGLGLVSTASAVEAEPEAQAAAEPAHDPKDPALVDEAALATGAAAISARDFQRPAISPPTPPGQARRRSGGMVAAVVGLVMLVSILRTCGHTAHRPDSSASVAGQFPIAVDAAAPVQSSPPSPVATTADQAAADAAATPAAASAAPEIAAGPSFDCDRVTGENLKLICATPDLAAADRTLAAVYQQARATTTDPAALRDSQRAWIVARNAAPADIDQLRALYAERIQILRNQAAAKTPEPF